MNRRLFLYLVIPSLSLFLISPASSQTQIGAHRFELRDLGVPFVDAIPPDESAITSLVVFPDGDVYGGTSGPVCNLFVFSTKTNRIKPLGNIPGHQSIHHAMVVGSDNNIYIGTGLNELKQYPISDPVPGHGGIIISLWNDIENRYKTYEGGHLYRFGKDQCDEVRTEINKTLKLEDLGIPVAHNGIYALTTSPQRTQIYGLTYPHGRFFVYDIESKKITNIGEVYKKKVYGGPNRSLRSISRSLICDREGNIYGSADDERIFKFIADSGKLTVLNITIPHIYIAVIEALIHGLDGLIYGGTSEGFLFKFDPEKLEIVNLGKPLDQMRIRALTAALDGKIYGIAGERKDRCHFFYFDPESGGFTDLGIINIDRTPYYLWMGKQFDAMVTGLDGTIYIGESERKSHLFIFYP